MRIETTTTKSCCFCSAIPCLQGPESCQDVVLSVVIGLVKFAPILSLASIFCLSHRCLLKTSLTELNLDCLVLSYCLSKDGKYKIAVLILYAFIHT